MIKTNTQNVDDAFDILLDEIQNEIDLIKKSVSSAMADEKYDKVQNAVDTAKRINEFEKNVRNLREEWKNIMLGVSTVKKRRGRPPKSKLERAKKGEITPEHDFFIPILQIIKEEGGSAKTKYVVRKVGIMMSGNFTLKDREPVPSNPNQTRWDNRVRWARNTLITKGLLKSNSPRGLWEITQKGRNYLDKHLYD